MGVGRRADHDRVDVVAGNDRVGVRCRLAAQLVGQGAGRGLDRVDDRDEGCLRVGGRVGGVDPADAAGTEHGEANHEMPPADRVWASSTWRMVVSYEVRAITSRGCLRKISEMISTP